MIKPTSPHSGSDMATNLGLIPLPWDPPESFTFPSTWSLNRAKRALCRVHMEWHSVVLPQCLLSLHQVNKPHLVRLQACAQWPLGFSSPWPLAPCPDLTAGFWDSQVGLMLRASVCCPNSDGPVCVIFKMSSLTHLPAHQSFLST